MRTIFMAVGLVSFSVALVVSCGSSDSKQVQRASGGEGGDEPAAGGGTGIAGPGSGGAAGARAVGTSGEGGGGAAATFSGGAGGASGEATGIAGAAAGAGGAGALPAAFPVFNTGVDDQGIPLAAGSVDPHYTLIESADPTFTGPDAIVPTSIAEGYWLPESDTSQWIAPSTDQTYPNPSPCNAAGTYIYRTTFTLGADEASTFTITGGWAADNAGSDVVLNDVSLGITAGSYSPCRRSASTVALLPVPTRSTSSCSTPAVPTVCASSSPVRRNNDQVLQATRNISYVTPRLRRTQRRLRTGRAARQSQEH